MYTDCIPLIICIVHHRQSKNNKISRQPRNQENNTLGLQITI